MHQGRSQATAYAFPFLLLVAVACLLMGHASWGVGKSLLGLLLHKSAAQHGESMSCAHPACLATWEKLCRLLSQQHCEQDCLEIGLAAPALSSSALVSSHQAVTTDEAAVP